MTTQDSANAPAASGQAAPSSKTPSATSPGSKKGRGALRIVLSVVMVAAVVVILGREIKPSELKDAFAHANLWWVLAAAIVAALSWLGAALPLKGLASIKISLKDATLVQVAASFVGVVAPMGLGPVSMHLDYLKRRGMTDAAAAAVVAFIELAQVMTSLLLLGISLLFDHDFPHSGFPIKKIAIIAGIVVLVLLMTLAVPKVRDWVWSKARTFWGQVQTQLKYLKTHPSGYVWAFVGVTIQTVTTALALVYSMKAVGHPISVFAGITIYLIGNTLGSAVPTPGGIGSTLAATVAALHVIGVPTPLAVSGVLIYRMVSFYLQVPIGWLGFTYMQRKNLL